MSHDILQVTLQTTRHEVILHGFQKMTTEHEVISHDRAVLSVVSMVKMADIHIASLSYNKTIV